MAYCALVSLMNTLELYVNSNLFDFFHAKHYVLSFYRKVRYLQTLFQDSPPKSSDEEMNSLETRICDAAYRIEDMVESNITEQVLQWDIRIILGELDPAHEDSSTDQVYQDMEEAMMEIDSIMEQMLTDRCGLKGLLPRKFFPAVGGRTSVVARSGKSTMVGFDEDVRELKERLAGHGSKLQTIPIVGMGGMGKTTLARNLFDDSLVVEHFDIRAWATISQTYVERKVLKRLLKNMGVATSKKNKNEEESIQDLRESLYKTLKGRRYLILLDDIWSTESWDDLKRIFPDDCNGSRIVLTTRLMDMVRYANDSSSAPHEMHLLDEDKSWDLLCQEVFGQRGCPPQFEELEDIGKEIARNCKGLPLSISVIGGLLATLSMNRAFWEKIAQNVNSIAIKIDEHCSEILSLSYNHLPHHLEACFLYFGLFPKSYEISVRNLIRLWIAEGFLRPIKLKRLEDAAEEHLHDLIGRNLISVVRRGSNGKIKSCGVHDLVRDLCIKEAQKKNFLHEINPFIPYSPYGTNSSRRLGMHLPPNGIRNTMRSAKRARSLLCTSEFDPDFPFDKYLTSLRVLDLLDADMLYFPLNVQFLFNLRYLAIGCQFTPLLRRILGVLWNLQVLTTKDHIYLLSREVEIISTKRHPEVKMPPEILRLAYLRHVQLTEFLLPDPIHSNEINSVVLKYLETLSTVANFKCTEEVLKKFPNLRKLGVYYYASEIKDWSVYHLENLARFSKLENLKCFFNWTVQNTWLQNVVLPQSLKKLTLIRTKLVWKDMTVIGSLPNLEVLKLKKLAFAGPLWEPVDGEFRRLIFLQIHSADLVQWEADETHFPCLEQLIISECSDLKEIPSGIGEIATLKVIEIDNSSPSVVASVEQILEEQQNNGNDALHVRWGAVRISDAFASVSKNTKRGLCLPALVSKCETWGFM